MPGYKAEYTAESMNKAVDEYFSSTDTPTRAGMLLHLDISKETWLRYKNNDCESDDPTIQLERTHLAEACKKADLRIERMLETMLVHGDAKRVTAAIFGLKQYGWTDQQQQSVSGTININLQGLGNDAGK